MAEAVASEDKITCDLCHEQILVDDWKIHTEKCRTTRENSDDDDDEFDRKKKVPLHSPDIPCEYCESPVPFSQFEEHTKSCARIYQRQLAEKHCKATEELMKLMIPCEICQENFPAAQIEQHARNCGGNVPNSPEAMIPCEYCSKTVHLHEFNLHTKQCAEKHQRRSVQPETRTSPTDFVQCEFCHESFPTSEIERHSRFCLETVPNSPGEAMIPCEYCLRTINIHQYDWHTRQCAENHRRHLTGRTTTNSLETLLPCEICGETFPFDQLNAHQTECQRQRQATAPPMVLKSMVGTTIYPDTWNLTSYETLTRHILDRNSDEYARVAAKFNETLKQNRIVQIERIQNTRWYRQYDAHRDDFIDRYGRSTEELLFHGCRGESAELIIKDCFNRSHATRCAVGQGIYFARNAAISLSYTQPDANRNRHMFLARVLVGKTTGGSAATKVCPAGFDTTGGGDVFVTYHDAQAYGEYLITFQ